MTIHVQQTTRVDRFDPARAAFRTVLTHVQPEADAAPRLKAAVALARRLEATLHGVGAEMIPPMAMSDPSGLLAAELGPVLQATIEANLRKAKAEFRKASEGLSREWTAAEEEPLAAMARLCRAADLVVAGGSPLNYRDGTRWCDPAQLVLQSGRPVLVVPPLGGELVANNIVVAFKDTREARRALNDTLPLLQSADEVLVVEICAPDEVADAEYRVRSIAEHLKRHQVAARSDARAAPPSAVAAELNQIADGFEADLIVAGGYGHSRLGEWIFGGVTRDLLQHASRFVLLSH